VVQPEDVSTAESANLREPGAASDSADIAAGANNPTAACGFLLEKQPSAEVLEALLQPSQHAESSKSAQTEASLQPSQHAESGTSAQTEALLQPGQHAESGTYAQTEAQSVIAGASMVAAANQKPSQRRNLVAFMSLLRVMHR